MALRIKKALTTVSKVFLSAFVFSIFVYVLIGTYRLGFTAGFGAGQSEAETDSLTFKNLPFLNIKTPLPTSTSEPISSQNQSSNLVIASWGGPDLWSAVNERRIELGVNPLSQALELCTIASIRLNELLELGKLDSHEGFSNMPERRSDLKWIFDKYSTVAEFLALGGKTPEETVSLWENTLGHRKLLDGGEYVWGCIYAQNTFAVAITAF